MTEAMTPKMTPMQRTSSADSMPPQMSLDRLISNSPRHVLVVDVRGLNKVGITVAFVDAINAAGQSCKILDIVQYVIEGSLSIIFMIEIGERSSMVLIKNMLSVARNLEMRLDFRFLEQHENKDISPVEAKEDNILSISIVLDAALSVDMVHQIFEHLAGQSCQVLEIENLSDNRMEITNELTKLDIRISAPSDVSVSTLYLELQPLLWKFNAELVVRPWSAMSRPNGRSLVVFGLSDVLLSGCPLDDLLRKSGKDPASLDMTGANGLEQYNRKVHALAGCEASIMQEVVDELEFTTDAEFVCRCLKAMGFRLAILSSAGCKLIANTVKERFGMDYVLSRDLEVDDEGKFTGDFAGEVKDMKFQKTDFLHLMAEKESIPYKNVIVVGEFLKGVKRDSFPDILDTFGPPIFFNSNENKSLVSVLYLLGFSGNDVKSLRMKYSTALKHSASGLMEASRKASKSDCKAGNPQTPETHVKRLVRITGPRSDASKMAHIFESMKTFSQEGQCSINTIKQRTLSESMIMGVEIAVNGSDIMETLLKEALFACQTEGFTLQWDENPTRPLPGSPREPDSFWGRHVVTIVQKPSISPETLAAVTSRLASMNCDITTLERLSKKDFAALQITAAVPDGQEKELKNILLATGKENGADVAFQEESVDRWNRRLIVFDMDSTLIQQEVIDELAKLAGVEAQVKEITERAMSGELDFFASLKERVALLKGHNAEELFSHVKKNLIYTPGAKQLCSTLKGLGYKMAVISGGFLPVAREVQRELALDYAFANTLEVDRKTGLLTGRTIGPVVTPQRKRALLSMIAEVEGCEVAQTIAVGDGANDIPMLCTAGLGVAFCAKPKVQAVAEFRVNTLDLSTVLYLIGLSEFAVEEIEK
jgi:phosphoserine phosphatase SerB